MGGGDLFSGVAIHRRERFKKRTIILMKYHKSFKCGEKQKAPKGKETA